MPRAQRINPGRQGTSVADFAGARLVYSAAEPSVTGRLERQLNDAIDYVEAASGLSSVYHLVLFVADEQAIATCRQHLKARFGAHAPATTFVPQAPLSGHLLALEAWSALSQKVEVGIHGLADDLVELSLGDLGLVFTSHLEARAGTLGVFNQTVSTLSRLRMKLARAGVGFDQILRTWYYLGGIVDSDDHNTQRYKEMNRARAAFYEGVDFLAECRPPGQPLAAVYPASTGIGSLGRDPRVSALALLRHGPDLVVKTLENPRQTSAFEYASNYSPKSPQFSRALVLATRRDAMYLISGTASITGSESRFPDDIAAQTHQTIDNMEALIGHENLKAHGLPGLGASLVDLVQARIYVKRPQDAATVDEICASRFGGGSSPPAIIRTQADICRPELLVEIEAIAINHPK